MKTQDTDYGKFFPLEDGKFPEEYPFKEPFHKHVHKIGLYLNAMKNDKTVDDLFLDELDRYKKLGFIYFYDKCMKQYEDIIEKRLKKLEDDII